MKEKTPEIKVLFSLMEELPPFAGDFLMTRAKERTLGTRIAYSRDFLVFLQYLIDVDELCHGKKTKDITFEDLKRVTPLEIDTFLSIYAEDHKESATSRVKTSICAFYKYACDTLQKIDKNPVNGAGKIKIPKKDYVIYLNYEEQEKLLNTLKYGTGLSKKQLIYHTHTHLRDTALIFLFLDTGLRVSEICSLEIRDVDFSDNSLIVRRKRGKMSKIYFSDEATKYLLEYLEERKSKTAEFSRPESPLFLSLQNTALSVREVQSLVPKYVKAALPEKMQNISPHKLRSSFAMGFYAATHDILALQERMGHESLTTTNIYVKAAKEHIRDSRNWRNV